MSKLRKKLTKTWPTRRSNFCLHRKARLLKTDFTRVLEIPGPGVCVRPGFQHGGKNRSLSTDPELNPASVVSTVRLTNGTRAEDGGEDELSQTSVEEKCGGVEETPPTPLFSQRCY